jgi:hypothetical protein
MNYDKLREAAEDEAAECRADGRQVVHSISTFGMHRTRGVTEDEIIVTICREAPVGGRNVWLTSSSELLNAGFEIELSEPPPHHYNVILGPELISADIKRLVEVLEPNRRRNPAWRR